MENSNRNEGSVRVLKTINHSYSEQSYQDYLLKNGKSKREKLSRYVRFSERKEECELPEVAFEQVAKGKFSTCWKGVPVMKCCFDLMAYQQLMWEMKPKAIIELGTSVGGSALWMSDIMSAYGLDFHIYTMDIDTDQLHKAAKHAKNTTFMKGDSFHIEKCFTSDFLKSLPHPWLIIEDVHMNVLNIMKYFHNYLHRGDYFIMEDTNLAIENYYPPGYYDINTENDDGLINYCVLDFSKAPQLNLVRQKKSQVEAFMKSHDDDYVVDAKVQDMFGINGSWNMNSTFMRI